MSVSDIFQEVCVAAHPNRCRIQSVKQETEHHSKELYAEYLSDVWRTIAILVDFSGPVWVNCGCRTSSMRWN